MSTETRGGGTPMGEGETAVSRRRRVYTGAALERRRAWGKWWGGKHSEFWKAQRAKEQ